MKKLCINLLFILTIFTVIPTTSLASGSGGYLSYHLKQDSVYISLTIMRDCSRSQLANTARVELENGATAPITLILNEVSETDITAMCSSALSRCSSNPSVMIRSHRAKVYEGVAYIGGNLSSYCNWDIEYIGGIWPIDLTSGQATQQTFIDASFNRCLVSENHSPEFSPNSGILHKGQSTCLAIGAIDTIEQHTDSISFELVRPKTTPFKTSPPLPIYAFTFLGAPAMSIALPYGYHFNQTTGELCFQPIVAGERGAIGVQATEWRKINNQWEEIGKVYNSFEMSVVDASNSIPILQNTGAKLFCTEDSLCFEILTSDSNATDSTFVSWRHNMPGAIVTSDNGSVKNAKITCCWKPDSSDITSRPYLFQVTATDNNCPRAARNYTTIAVTVRTPLPEAMVMNQIACNQYEFYVPDSSGLTIHWFINGVLAGTQERLTKQFLSSGSFTIEAVITNVACSDTLTETIAIDPISIPIGNLPHQQTVCPDIATTYTVSATQGSTPYLYEWIVDGTIIDSGSTIQYQPTTDSTELLVRVTDATGCAGIDTTLLVLDQVPQVDAGQYTSVCPGTTQPLNGLPASGIWSGNGVSGTNFQQFTADNYPIYYSVDNGNGCITTDTTTIEVLPLPIIQPGSYAAVCEGSTPVSLNGLPAGGQWSGLNTSGTQFIPSLAGQFDIHYVFTDQNGCTDSAQTQITVHALPQVQPGTYPDVCFGAQAVDLTGIPAGGAWSGNQVTDNTFYPSTTGLFALHYSYTDQNGCSNSATTQIEVNPLPTVDAGSYTDVCEGSAPVLLSGMPSGGLWSGAQVNNQELNTGIPGNYTITYTFTDQNQCTNSDQVIILINPNPAVDFSTSTVSGTAPLKVDFTNLSSGEANVFTWSFGDPGSGALNGSTLENPFHVFNQAGTYTIDLKASNSLTGCQDSLTKAAYIEVMAPTTGIRTLDISGTLQISPNPARHDFTITFDALDTYQIEVLDMQGRTVLEKTLNHTKQGLIDVHQLEKANYLIKATDTQGKVYVGRIILE